SAGPQGGQGTGELLPAAGDVAGIVAAHQHRVGGVHHGRHLAGGRAADLYPARGDEFRGLGTGTGEPAADQLRVQAGASGHHCSSILARVSRSTRCAACNAGTWVAGGAPARRATSAIAASTAGCPVAGGPAAAGSPGRPALCPVPGSSATGPVPGSSATGPVSGPSAEGPAGAGTSSGSR